MGINYRAYCLLWSIKQFVAIIIFIFYYNVLISTSPQKIIYSINQTSLLASFEIQKVPLEIGHRGSNQYN